MESPEKELSEELKTAITWVQDYLSRRSHSEKELLDKLSKKDFPKETSKAAVSFARNRGWLESPEELSEKVYNEWDQKNKSHIWIIAYLEGKGLPGQERNPRREADKAAYLLSKKFGKINNSNYQRAASNISSKGFNFEDFKEALNIMENTIEGDL